MDQWNFADHIYMHYFINKIGLIKFYYALDIVSMWYYLEIINSFQDSMLIPVVYTFPLRFSKAYISVMGTR
jgi:hypothetical protein